jgi:hypothetical protein
MTTLYTSCNLNDLDVKIKKRFRCFWDAWLLKGIFFSPFFWLKLRKITFILSIWHDRSIRSVPLSVMVSDYIWNEKISEPWTCH